MSGKYRAAAAIIQHDYPKALYVHCVSHVLNLCVVAACIIQAIQNMMELWMKSASSSTASQNGNKSYKSILKIYQLEPLVKKKLMNLCKTRWVARIEGFEVFRDMLPALVSTLELLAQHIAGALSLQRKHY